MLVCRARPRRTAAHCSTCASPSTARRCAACTPRCARPPTRTSRSFRWQYLPVPASRSVACRAYAVGRVWPQREEDMCTVAVVMCGVHIGNEHAVCTGCLHGVGGECLGRDVLPGPSRCARWSPPRRPLWAQQSAGAACLSLALAQHVCAICSSEPIQHGPRRRADVTSTVVLNSPACHACRRSRGSLRRRWRACRGWMTWRGASGRPARAR